MSEAKPIIVVKKNVKRPSGVRLVADPVGDLTWIAHLHRLWAIPRAARDVRCLSA